MKTKKFEKKLSLSKHTIADLNKSTMEQAKGGTMATTTITLWITLCIDFTCTCTDGDICNSVKNSCLGKICPQIPPN